MEKFYNGFFIEKAQGNNAFSYDKRKNKKIYIAPIENIGNLNSKKIVENLQEGKNIAFSEYDIENNKEINCKGIEKFLNLQDKEKEIFIFDNHNHSFFFINYALNNTKPYILYHFDQHKDTSIPPLTISQYTKCNKDYSLKQIFDYTNYCLNVGNFLIPLKEAKIIEDMRIIDSSYNLENVDNFLDQDKEKNIILDIDLDFFSSDMDYIKKEDKIKEIVKVYQKANIITICTSPYFIEFEKAKKALVDIVERIIFL